MIAYYHTMNEILYKRLLTGNTHMPEIHLRQPEFTYEKK